MLFESRRARRAFLLRFILKNIIRTLKDRKRRFLRRRSRKEVWYIRLSYFLVMVNRRHKEPDPLAETPDFKRLYVLNWRDEDVQMQHGIAKVGTNGYYFFSKELGQWSNSANKKAAIFSLLRTVRHTISTRPRLGVTLPAFPVLFAS